MNGRAKITYFDGDQLYNMSCYLKAVFLGSFELYGRLHTSGYRHAQGLSKTERGTIRISTGLGGSGDAAELDYSALHPRMLYADQGIQYRGDPYDAVIDDAIYGLLRSGECRRLRSWSKAVLLALLNADSPQKAEKAGNYWLYEHLEDSRYIKSLGLRSARTLLEAFQRVHEPISEYFCSDAGLKLMNRDAKMALDVVEHFVSRGIPIIPIHDSFLISYLHVRELWRVMKETYRRHNNGFDCPVKYGVININHPRAFDKIGL